MSRHDDEPVGERIKHVMNRTGLEAHELGQLLGVDKHTINNWATGFGRLSRAHLAQLTEIEHVVGQLSGWTWRGRRKELFAPRRKNLNLYDQLHMNWLKRNG